MSLQHPSQRFCSHITPCSPAQLWEEGEYSAAILTLEVLDKGRWLYHAPTVLKSLSHVVLHDTYHAEAALVTCGGGEDDRTLGTNTVEFKAAQDGAVQYRSGDGHHIPFQSHTSTVSAALTQPSALTQAGVVWDGQLSPHKASRSRWSHLSPGYTHHGHKCPQTQGCKAQGCCYGWEKGAVRRNSISVEKWQEEEEKAHPDTHMALARATWAEMLSPTRGAGTCQHSRPPSTRPHYSRVQRCSLESR